jgi:hypothetical protein
MHHRRAKSAQQCPRKSSPGNFQTLLSVSLSLTQVHLEHMSLSAIPATPSAIIPRPISSSEPNDIRVSAASDSQLNAKKQSFTLKKVSKNVMLAMRLNKPQQSDNEPPIDEEYVYEKVRLFFLDFIFAHLFRDSGIFTQFLLAGRQLQISFCYGIFFTSTSQHLFTRLSL